LLQQKLAELKPGLPPSQLKTAHSGVVFNWQDIVFDTITSEDEFDFSAYELKVIFDNTAQT